MLYAYVGDVFCEAENVKIERSIDGVGTCSFTASAYRFLNDDDPAKILSLPRQLQNQVYTLYFGNTLVSSGIVENGVPTFIESSDIDTIQFNCTAELGLLYRERGFSGASYNDEPVLFIVADLLSQSEESDWQVGYFEGLDETIVTTIDLRDKETLYAQLKALTERVPEFYIRYGSIFEGFYRLDVGPLGDKSGASFIQGLNLVSSKQIALAKKQLYEIEAFGGSAVSREVYLKDAYDYDNALATHYRYPVVEKDDGTWVVRDLLFSDGDKVIKRFKDIVPANLDRLIPSAVQAAGYGLWQACVNEFISVNGEIENYTIEIVESPSEGNTNVLSSDIDYIVNDTNDYISNDDGDLLARLGSGSYSTVTLSSSTLGEHNSEIMVDTDVFLMGNVLDETYASANQDTDTNLTRATSYLDKLAQPVSIGTAQNITQIRLWMKKIGSPTGTMTLRLETNSAGEPSGTLAHANATTTVAESGLAVGYDWIAFDFTDFSVSAGTYWLVLTTTRAPSATNYIAWGTDASAPSYASGGMLGRDARYIWSDSHGTNHLSDVTGVFPTTGIQGNAAQFVAANTNYLYCASNADLAGADAKFAFIGWVNFDSLATLQCILSKYGNAGDREYLLWMDQSTSKMRFTVSNDGTATSGVVSTVVLAPSTNYLVAAWHDSVANVLGIAVNGTITTASYSNGVWTGTYNFQIGKYAAASGYLGAHLDEWGKWNGWVPDATALAALYNGGAGVTYAELAGLGLDTGLVSYWKLDDTNPNPYTVLAVDGCFEIYSSLSGLAQSFTLSSSKTIDRLRLWLKKIALPTGIATIEVQTNNAGVPSGTLVDTNATTTVNETDLDTAYEWILANFSNFNLDAGIYWIVLTTDRALDAANYIAWGTVATTPAYSGGEMKSYTSLWSAENKDAAFGVFYILSESITLFLAQTFTFDSNLVNELSNPVLTLQPASDAYFHSLLQVPLFNLHTQSYQWIDMLEINDYFPIANIKLEFTKEQLIKVTITTGIESLEKLFDTDLVLAERQKAESSSILGIGEYPLPNSVVCEIVSDTASMVPPDTMMSDGADGKLFSLAIPSHPTGGSLASGVVLLTNAVVGTFTGYYNMVAQPFTLGGRLTTLSFKLGAAVNSPENSLTWEIRRDENGLPGLILQTGSFTPVASSTNTITIEHGVGLKDATQYWAVLRTTSNQAVEIGGSRYWIWEVSNASSLGSYAVSPDGATWIEVPGSTDLIFSVETDLPSLLFSVFSPNKNVIIETVQAPSSPLGGWIGKVAFPGGWTSNSEATVRGLFIFK